MCCFTCNTGYRPQGIDTRFCQNDGWSGTDLDFACFQGLYNYGSMFVICV